MVPTNKGCCLRPSAAGAAVGGHRAPLVGCRAVLLLIEFFHIYIQICFLKINCQNGRKIRCLETIFILLLRLQKYFFSFVLVLVPNTTLDVNLTCGSCVLSSLTHITNNMFLFQSKPKEKSNNLSLNPLYVVPDEHDSAAQKELEIQRVKWDSFLQSRPNIWNEEWLWMNRLVPADNGGPIKKKFMQMFNSKTKLRKRVKALIRSGVPPELRGDVWYACAGAATKMKSSSRDQQYPELVKRLHELDNTLIAIDIEKDLLRTFPEKICVEDQKLVDTLRRLLRAFALRNRSVGYCQSMNYVCALLLFHMEEERAFWTFSALLEDILPNDYYIPSLIGGRIDQQVFQSCIAWKLPKVYEAFRATNTVLEPIICPWFMCLYVNVLPLYAVCRVWDCLFWEGSVVLFRIGLTLVKSKSNEIVKATDFIGVYTVLKGSNVKSH